MATTCTNTEPDIWSNWTFISSITSTATEDIYIWTQWCGGTASTSTATSDTILWINWMSTEVVARDNPEAVARREEEIKRKRIRDARLRRMKMLRSKKLLKEHLDAEQLAMLMDNDHFHVRCKSGQLYRINNGRVGNIDVMENGSRKHGLCAHPEDYVPNYDTMLAQKLMLETNEDEFVRIANIHH